MRTHHLGSLVALLLLLNSTRADDEVRLFQDAPNSHVWFSSEYLLWWFKQAPVPVPLVTSASLLDPLPGAIGQPHTSVSIGDHSVGGQPDSGGRFSVGTWLDSNSSIGVEASYLFMASQFTRASVATSGQPGSPNVAVPFFDPSGIAGLKGIPGETIFILPGPLPSPIPSFQGLFKLDNEIQMNSGELNSIWAIGRSRNLQFDGVCGFRWVEVAESLTLSGQTSTIQGASPGFYNFFDRFDTQNNFFGGQLGFRARCQFDRFLIVAGARVALGDSHQSAQLNGAGQTSSGNLFLSTSGTSNQVMPGGIFVQPTNIGHYNQDVFAVVPEGKLELTYRLTSHIRLTLCYTFLYDSSVARPGDQIDRQVNITRTALADLSRSTVGVGSGPVEIGQQPGRSPLPFGPDNPLFHFHDSGFWAQGINVGMTVQF